MVRLILDTGSEQQQRSPRTAPSPDLVRTLEVHKRWLETKARAGARAELEGADLTGLDLGGRDLRRARLVRCNLSSAYLRHANLSGADLHGSKFGGAELGDASFRAANLRSAELKLAIDLSVERLGGADLSGCDIPEAIAAFSGLEAVDKVSKQLQYLFQLTLGVCAFSLFTAMSIPDESLVNLAPSAGMQVPFFQASISAARFVAIMPIVIFIIYIYTLNHLRILWKLLSTLPAVFPDGVPLDRRAYPLILNSLIRKHLPRLRRENPSWLQVSISYGLAVGIAPFTIAVFWITCLRKHDSLLTLVQVLLLALAVSLMLAYARLAPRQLRGQDGWRPLGRSLRSLTRQLDSALAEGQAPDHLPRRWPAIRALAGDVLPRLAFIPLGLVLWWVSLAAFSGANPQSLEIVSQREAGLRSLNDCKLREVEIDLLQRRFVPGLVGLVTFNNFNPFLNLSGRALSIRPANWPENDDASIDLASSVAGADLEACDLRFARAYRAFLVNAYMRKVDLTEADLRAAELMRADLRGAKFAKANLRWASLRGAYLSAAVLTKARLKQADLRDAHFAAESTHERTDPELNGAAHLEDADLRDADLQNADLRGAFLHRADLRGAKLAGADFQGAQTDGTDFRGVDLSQAKNLSSDQIKKGILNPQTKVPAQVVR
jgi:uncharacterized protein YjbI with pentapeptide repeats